MLFALILAWLWWNEPLPVSRISRDNQARLEAEQAYQSGWYDRALSLYTALSRTTTTIDPAVRLNLGHTYFKLGQYDKASRQYTTLLGSDRPDLRTVAATQLGVIACLGRDSASALVYFQQALLEDYTNEPARYNYELIRKRYAPRKPTGQTKAVAQSPKPVNQPQPSGGQVERSARQDELLRRFQRLNLTQEQALQLLDAMQNDDLPYALTRSARRSTSAAAGGNRW